jgi:hypothetical protein
MEAAKWIVQARPGLGPGRGGERRPLRERVELPVSRRIFIDRESHPEADIYVATHEARNLPDPVPDYQTPHCHNTDEFYFFLGAEPDLGGLEGEIRFEGKVHRIVSPATVFIPAGTVHEYKVTRGSGTVVVLFRSRGYDHTDKEPDLERGEREAEAFARCIFGPERRASSEIEYHRETAPGRRYVFVDGKLLPRAGFYAALRTVAGVAPTQSEYVERHAHNCDTYHVAIGTGPDGSGLKIEFTIGEEKILAESPLGVHVPAGARHSQRIVEGSGHFFNFVPKSNYSESLLP